MEFGLIYAIMAYHQTEQRSLGYSAGSLLGGIHVCVKMYGIMSMYEYWL